MHKDSHFLQVRGGELHTLIKALEKYRLSLGWGHSGEASRSNHLLYRFKKIESEDREMFDNDLCDIQFTRTELSRIIFCLVMREKFLKEVVEDYPKTGNYEQDDVYKSYKEELFALDQIAERLRMA